MGDIPTILLDDGIAARIMPSPADKVLWIHGYTLNSSIWGALWELLPGWSHIGIDLPGHGGSEQIRPGENLSTLASRIGASARRWAARHLVGLSFGGTLALQIAIEYPDAFASLGLSSPGLGGGPLDEA